MTKDERIRQLLLAQKHLGRVFPLHGVMPDASGGLLCTCRHGHDCGRAGKHPMKKRWQALATRDPEQLLRWIEEFPSANFGVVTGEGVIGLDVDVRVSKDGEATLDRLRVGVLHAPTVLTGRGNGSRHLYFLSPPKTLRNRRDFLPGLDLRGWGGYLVAPGSRHVSGGFYQFAPGLGPNDLPLADLPVSLASTLNPPSRMTAVAEKDVGSGTSEKTMDTGPDAPLPDYQVRGRLLYDGVGRFYYYGARNRKHSRSEDDFALACKLAYFCRHNLQQMYRLFMASGLRRLKWTDQYVLRTLRQAIAMTPERWSPKPRVRRSRATGAKRGRKVSPITLEILNQSRTHLRTPAEIARRLRMRPSYVRDVLWRWRNRTIG